MLGNDDPVIQRHHRRSEGIPAGIAQPQHIIALLQHIFRNGGGGGEAGAFYACNRPAVMPDIFLVIV